MTRTIVSALALLAAASAATAGSYAPGCTTAPRSAWLTIADAEARAVSEGYAVSKSKVTGTCYEVYATRDAKRFELFYDPTSARLIASTVK